MSGKYFFGNFEKGHADKPNGPIDERVVGESGRKDLPPGTEGGENLKPDRHYEHKQHTFDSYCKKVLKCEAYNGYREIAEYMHMARRTVNTRRQKAYRLLK